jgi:hypothetical protein
VGRRVTSALALDSWKNLSRGCPLTAALACVCRSPMWPQGLQGGRRTQPQELSRLLHLGPGLNTRARVTLQPCRSVAVTDSPHRAGVPSACFSVCQALGSIPAPSPYTHKKVTLLKEKKNQKRPDEGGKGPQNNRNLL